MLFASASINLNNFEEVINTLIFNDYSFYLTEKNGDEFFVSRMGGEDILFYKMRNYDISQNCSKRLTRKQLIAYKDNVKDITVIREMIE